MKKNQISQLIKSRVHPKKLATSLTAGNDLTTQRKLRNICEIAEQIKCDKELADQLYAAPNHEANLLATLIDDPESYTPDQMEQRVKQLYPSPFAERFCRKVLANTPFAVEQVYYWQLENTENSRYLALLTLAGLADQRNNLSRGFFEAQMQALSCNLSSTSQLEKEACKKVEQSIARRKHRKLKGNWLKKATA